ncbi:MAG: TetR family transcriptional regulator [Planctomycetota bacterium]
MQEDADCDAGIAVGTLYLYFKNKDELVVALAPETSSIATTARRRRFWNPRIPPTRSRAHAFLRYCARGDHRTALCQRRTHPRCAVRDARIARDEGMIIPGYIKEILAQGVSGGLFDVADIDRDARRSSFTL